MLGVCCHWLHEVVKRGGSREFRNEMGERSLQLGRYRSGKYTEDQIRATYTNNVRNLFMSLPMIHAAGIRHFRISSSLLPLADQVPPSIWNCDDVKHHLARAGAFIKSHDMRVTTHPGQFTVLSSDSDRVVENSIRELSIHSWIFDAMGLDHSPKWSINIHGGKSNRSARLVDSIKSLPSGVRNRLTLENDERCYNVIDLLSVHRDTGVPVCFDSHHHTFNEGDLTMQEAFDAACDTWLDVGIRPLQHISNTDPSRSTGSFLERRKHSDFIHYVPSCQLIGIRDGLIDVEVEAKQKNIAVFKMAKDFGLELA